MSPVERAEFEKLKQDVYELRNFFAVATEAGGSIFINDRDGRVTATLPATGDSESPC